MSRKVLIVLVPYFDPYSGGVPMTTYKLATYFAKSGFDVSVFSFSHEHNRQFESISVFSARSPGLNYSEENIKKLREVIDTVRPDIVINQMPYEHNIGSALKDMKGIVNYLLLGCLRGSFFAVKLNLETYRQTLLPRLLQPFFKNPLGYRLLLMFHRWKHSNDLRKILDTYDYYVLFGEPNRIELEYFVGKYMQHKLVYIPNSVPKVEVVVPHKEKRILWLSRLDYRQKHAELIIPLWKLLKDRLPDWQFDVVGDGGALQDLKEQVRVEKIERITFFGKQDPSMYFSRSPIYLMTSSFEGFPNTLIEAQSFAAVPVVFNSYPMLENIVDETNAILVKTFDIHGMANRVVELASDEGRLGEMAKNALHNASQYTIDRVGRKWLALFARHQATNETR